MKSGHTNDTEDGVNFAGCHPVVYIQAKGHGIFFDTNHGLYGLIGIGRDGIDDWDETNFRTSTDRQLTGVVYRYKGFAEEPVPTLENEYIVRDVGYNLIGLRNLWNLRGGYEVIIDEFGRGHVSLTLSD